MTVRTHRGLALAAALLAAPALCGEAGAWQARDGLPLPTCDEVRASRLVGAALGDAFYRRYPRSLEGEGAVERVALDRGEVANVVGYLACVAGLTGYDPTVAEQGLALFASRRHGAAAFAALDGIARGGRPEAGFATAFRRQIRGYLAGPGR
ncbi:MAG: hypothetical protein PGN34_00245 [Methylobacterium frigidaeris]